jgi:hypothetical protein
LAGFEKVSITAARQFCWHEIRRRRKSEGGQKFLPPNPLPFCPPELKSFSKFSVRIFAKKSSDFVQRSEPTKITFIQAVIFYTLM